MTRKVVFRSIYLTCLAVLIVTEIVAVVDKAEGDTISEMVWTALDALSASSWHVVALPAVFIFSAGGALWLVVHFFRRVWSRL